MIAMAIYRAIIRHTETLRGLEVFHLIESAIRARVVD